tara:strand:+ start:212 stop:547 length:336 start_codon:yes stop_codon:yes gene_type:complete
MSFKLEIISPQTIVFNDDIDLCILPGIEGDFGILKNHMPFLTTLRLGIAYVYKEKKLIETYLVSGGVVEVSDNQCTLLTEEIIKSNEFIISNQDDKIDKKKEKIANKLYYS